MAAAFLALPLEITDRVLAKLEASQVLAVGQTCVLAHSLIVSNHLWRKLCGKRWPEIDWKRRRAHLLTEFHVSDESEILSKLEAKNIRTCVYQLLYAQQVAVLGPQARQFRRERVVAKLRRIANNNDETMPAPITTAFLGVPDAMSYFWSRIYYHNNNRDGINLDEQEDRFTVLSDGTRTLDHCLSDSNGRSIALRALMPDMNNEQSINRALAACDLVSFFFTLDFYHDLKEIWHPKFRSEAIPFFNDHDLLQVELDGVINDNGGFAESIENYADFVIHKLSHEYKFDMDQFN